MKEASGSGQRVLVCDEERHVVRLIEVNLTRQGYHVSVALSGAEAISCLEAGPFDLAVIDRFVGDMTGAELANWIRSNPSTAELRVSFIGKEQDDDSGSGGQGT